VSCPDEIEGGLLAGHGVDGGDDAHVAPDQLAVGHAVAVLGDVVDEGHADAGLPVQGPQGVLGRPLHDGARGQGHPRDLDGVEFAGGDAARAPLALLGVDGGPVFPQEDRVGRAGLDAPAAEGAALADRGLEGRVHLELPCPGTAPHAQVLDGPPEAEEDVTLEVGDDDESPGLGDEAGDPDAPEDPPRDRDHRFLLAPLAVGDEDGHPQGAEPVSARQRQVVRCVVAAAPVKGIGIGEEVIGMVSRQARQKGPQVRGGDKAGVSLLPEVHLDGDAVLPPDPPGRIGQGPLEEAADCIFAEFLGKIDVSGHRATP